MDVARGEKFLATRLEPTVAGVGLTLRAVPVPAAVVGDGRAVPAVGAFRKPSGRLASTLDVCADAPKDNNNKDRRKDDALAAKRGKTTKAGAKPKTCKTAQANIPRFPAECQFALRHFLWNCSPAQRCQRFRTPAVEAFLWQVTTWNNCAHAWRRISLPSRASLSNPIPPKPPSGDAFGSMASILLFSFAKPFRSGRVPPHNHSSIHKQMAGRNTWCHPTLDRGLETCSPALKSVTCLQSLPWPKS